jgi:hypothetical protein
MKHFRFPRIRWSMDSIQTNTNHWYTISTRWILFIEQNWQLIKALGLTESHYKSRIQINWMQSLVTTIFSDEILDSFCSKKCSKDFRDVLRRYAHCTILLHSLGNMPSDKQIQIPLPTVKLTGCDRALLSIHQTMKGIVSGLDLQNIPITEYLPWVVKEIYWPYRYCKSVYPT